MKPDMSDLIERALSGAPSAQRELVEYLSPIIRARIARRLRIGGFADTTVLEDLSQELWVELFDRERSQLAKWRPEGMSLENFIGRAAEWQATRFLRARRRLKRAEITTHLSPNLSSDEDVENRVANRHLVQRVCQHLMTTLPEQGRRVLLLLYSNLRSVHEAAETLGVNRQVIYNWHQRIRSNALLMIGDLPRSPRSKISNSSFPEKDSPSNGLIRGASSSGIPPVSPSLEDVE